MISLKNEWETWCRQMNYKLLPVHIENELWLNYENELPVHIETKWMANVVSPNEISLPVHIEKLYWTEDTSH